MNQTRPSPWLMRFALSAALATLGLVCIGGLVTSKGVGMSVPDWPTSFGYGMFALPISTWLTGGVFHEHTHRLWASLVGVMIVGLTRWIGGRPARWPLALIGILELAAGGGLLLFGSDWRGAGHFLAGIGGVVLLAALVWVRHEPASPLLRWLGWSAFSMVQLQGLLGGLRVVLDKYSLGFEMGLLHGVLGQLFFLVVCLIALFSSSWWKSLPPASESRVSWLRFYFLSGTVLILAQLILGATMRHQHAGLAIPDFPLAYGKVWPAMDEASVAAYNSQRVETVSYNSITAFQIGLQMAHRILAGLILVSVAAAFALTRWRLANIPSVVKFSTCWLGLILLQVLLGATTVWTDKSADIATGHVAVGALSLMTGSVLTMISFRLIVPVRTPGRISDAGATLPGAPGSVMVAPHLK